MSDRIYSKPGAEFLTVAEGGPAGQVGTVGYRIEDADGNLLVARTTAGIVEVEAGSGTYRARPVAPAARGEYLVEWDTGTVTPETFSIDVLVVATDLAAALIPSSGITTDLVRARVETDLTDAALQALIDDAAQEIVSRYGPYRDVDAPILVTIPGRRRRLDILRPIDTTETVAVTEYVTADALAVEAAGADDEWIDVGATATRLAADDYRILNGGRTLERLFTGTNPRARWGSRVELTYVPVDDTARRDEVVTKIVILSLEYEGVIERRVGDVVTTHGLRSTTAGGSPLAYSDERARLLATLQPRRGILLR